LSALLNKHNDHDDDDDDATTLQIQTLHGCNINTSNMAAITVADRMTSQSAPDLCTRRLHITGVQGSMNCSERPCHTRSLWEWPSPPRRCTDAI